MTFHTRSGCPAARPIGCVVHASIPAPRPFTERFFNVQRWVRLPQGGHFAALEVPDVLAGQLRDYFRAYRTG